MIRAYLVQRLIRFIFWVTRTELYFDGGYSVLDCEWRWGRVGVMPR